MNSTIKNGLKLYVGIATCLIVNTAYCMQKSLEGKNITLVVREKKAYSQALKGTSERLRFFLDSLHKQECEEDNAIEANYSMLPFELNAAVTQQIIPKQINTTEELLDVLRNLTFLSEVDRRHKEAVESKETERTLLYALAPNYLILHDLEKKSESNKTKKVTFKVSKFFQNTLRALKTKSKNFEKHASIGSEELKTNIEQLLAFGINPNFQIDRESLLRWTIQNNDEDAMDFVIKKGADVNCVYQSYSALATAIRNHPSLAIKLLQQYKVNPETWLDTSIIPLLSLHRYSNEDCADRKKLIKILVKKGLSADSRTGGKYGHHLLAEAIILAQLDKKSDLVSFLLKKGAKVYDYKYWNGSEYHTLFEYAQGLPEILDLLESHQQPASSH